MSIRNAVLFDGDRATHQFRSQWAQKGALQPLLATAALIDQDRTATRYLRAAWAKAFPTRDDLPFEPIANPDGTASDAFWIVFN